jgi:hypothetical protein
MDASSLTDAVAAIDLERVRQLLSDGKLDPNATRDPLVSEESHQPDTPLKMVMFRVSDALLTAEDRAVLADIAGELLDAGAEPGPAMDIAQSRYGQYAGPDDQQTCAAWHLVAAAVQRQRNPSEVVESTTHVSGSVKACDLE